MASGLAAVDPDIFAANFHGEAGHGDGGVQGDFAGAYVILPAMPRAGDHFALQLALAERSATMQAGVVNGVESSVHIGDSQGRAVDLKFADGPRGNLIFSRRTQKRHFREPPVSLSSNDAALKGGAAQTRPKSAGTDLTEHGG